MSVTPVEFIAPGMSMEQLAFDKTSSTNQSFSSWMQNQISELNGAVAKSDALATQLATGQTDNLHQVMIGMEEAKIAFQLAVQVRNRVLEAYQDVLRMQI